jgi:predicted GH43/DUF377 family glycosyl hydrolase
MNHKLLLALGCVFLIALEGCRLGKSPLIEDSIPTSQMEEVFQKVKTPFKYGIVYRHPDSTKMVDSPSIFRYKSRWYMTYIVFDGQGYETWLAKSKDLLHWNTQGRILSFTKDTWDANQKAGYMALVNTKWGGSYQAKKSKGKYWMSYLGGASEGYEAGTLGVGMAHTDEVNAAQEWTRLEKPVLLPNDTDARWFERNKIYKSVIIQDTKKVTDFPYLIYYNAKGDTAKYESIGMAGSNDLTHWERIGSDPVITRYKGICGDAQIARMGKLYVMFYFGAFWKPGAFERFACSYDLIHWTDWQGEDLIAPSEAYDQKYAHKPWVVRWKGVTYHFYNAVGDQGRVIAVATSKVL